MSYRLVLIVAPQGAGKTSLLREWVQVMSKTSFFACAWVSLQQADNDLALFVQHLAAAFIQIDSNLVSVLPTLSQGYNRLDAPLNKAGSANPITSNPEERLIDLLNALAESSQEIVLILDEYHHIESAEVDQALSFFINYLPTNVHVYLASRSEPQFRLAHLRARCEMIEIGPDELSDIFE